MTTVSQIYEYVDSFAPYRTQDEWDNAGLLVGDGSQSVSKVLLALDATNKVIKEATELGCSLILTHHPVIFTPLRSLTEDNPACNMLKSGIACICSHTNLDSAEYSISDMMCDRLGLKNTHTLMDVNRFDSVTGRPVGYGAIGECSGAGMTPWQLAKLCREKFGCVAIKYVAGDRQIKHVGMISGAGGEGIEKARELGLDAFISSEIKHHQFLEAERIGVTLIDAGHYETEAIAMEYLKKKLEAQFPQNEFILARTPFAGCTV